MLAKLQANIPTSARAMIIDPLLATALIVLLVAVWRFVPHRPFWVGPAATLVLFALLTAVIVRNLGSPISPDFSQAEANIVPWYRVILAAWWIFAARAAIVVGIAVLQLGRHSREAKLVSDLISAGIYLAALLHVINTVFAVPIGGLVATSGVIAIVLGLALQNTLADVFSGIAVGIEGPISVGDRVWIEGGLEGEIVEINWRAIRIRTDSNDIAVVPHSLVAKSRLINRSYPTTRRGDAITISCDPRVAPDHVIDLMKRAILLCPAILKDPAPSVALVKMGAKSNKYQIAFSVSSSDLVWGARSSLLKEVARQFRYAGIQTTRRHETEDHIAGERDDAVTLPGAREMAVLPESYASDKLLDDLPLFHGLPQNCRRQLAGHLVRHIFEPQDIVFSQGATEASLFVIASGVLEVTRKTSERTHVLGRIGPGDYIGEIGMLTGVPHAATVTALTPSIVYELRKEDVAPLLASRPELVSAFEASARRGQELIARAVAAQASSHIGPPGQLLARIRAFFSLST